VQRKSRRAYEIYLERGEQIGRDFDDWLQAELEWEHLRVSRASGLASQSCNAETMEEGHSIEQTSHDAQLRKSSRLTQTRRRFDDQMQSKAVARKLPSAFVRDFQAAVHLEPRR
jgi:hypothetical protein